MFVQPPATRQHEITLITATKHLKTTCGSNSPEIVEESLTSGHRISDSNDVKEPTRIRRDRLRSGEILSHNKSLQIAQIRRFDDELVHLET